jgi:hypothetical protein
MANFNGDLGSDDDPMSAPPAPPLRRVLTSNSQEVLSTFSAINSFGHDTAADVLGKTADLEKSGVITQQEKLSVQRILLERGTAQAAAHLSTLQRFSTAGSTAASASPSSSSSPTSAASAPAFAPASAAAASSSSSRSPTARFGGVAAATDDAMDEDEAAMLAPPRLKKVLSNEGRRLLQSIGEQEVVPAPAAIPEEKKVKKKKKKKQSYQDLMSSFTKPTQTDEEVRQAHQARLASSLGGGQFSKLDKI